MRVASGADKWAGLVKFLESKQMQKVMHPILKWAQRKTKLYLTLELRDIKDEKIQLTETKITFSAQSDTANYEFSYEFFADINKEASKWEKTGFHMRFIFEKKAQGYWPRLIKDSKKTTYVQCDWDKWVDEDEEQEDAGKGLGNWDPNNMQNFGGEDSDDQEPANLDDLEGEGEGAGEGAGEEPQEEKKQ